MSTAVAHSPFSSFPKTPKASVPNPNPNFRFYKTLLSSSISQNSLDLSSIHGLSASSFRIASPLWSSSRPFHCTSVPSPLCNGGKRVFKIGAISEGETAGEEVETLLDTVKWDSNGLAVAIAQNVDTGAILMQGFTNREGTSYHHFDLESNIL